MDDPYPKELFSDLPLMHLMPIVNREAPNTGIYKCPLYKVVSRAGTLSTTGIYNIYFENLYISYRSLH